MTQLKLALPGRSKTKVPSLKMSEMELVHWTISRLSMAGYTVWRQNAGRIPIKNDYGKITRMVIVGHKGVSDIIGFSPTGRFCAFECKIAPNKPSPIQQLFLDDVNRAGGIGELVYTTEDVERIIKKYTN